MRKAFLTSNRYLCGKHDNKNKPITQMKKLFILLTLGCAAAFSSCLKNDRYESDVNAPGYDMYVIVMRQNIVALDPFNAAFRLNMLIAEGDGDYTEAPAEIKNALFSAGTTIAYDEPTGVYTLAYNGSPSSKDNVRTGTIRIRTNGYASLDEPQARWDIDLPQTNGYSIFDPEEIAISAESYAVENRGDNKWQASMKSFRAKFAVAENGSNWTAVYQIEQQEGGRLYKEVTKSNFLVSTFANNSTTMDAPMEADRLSASTPDVPFMYNPACSRRLPVAQGEMNIYLTNDTDLASFTTVQIGPDAPSVCYPVTRITYQGTTKEYELK